MSTETMVQVGAARLAKLEEMERKSKLSARRASVKNLIFVEKAKAAKIVVTKAEVDARIAADDAKKVFVAAPVSEAAPATDPDLGTATGVAPVSDGDPVDDEEEADAA